MMESGPNLIKSGPLLVSHHTSSTGEPVPANGFGGLGDGHEEVEGGVKDSVVGVG